MGEQRVEGITIAQVCVRHHVLKEIVKAFGRRVQEYKVYRTTV